MKHSRHLHWIVAPARCGRRIWRFWPRPGDSCERHAVRRAARAATPAATTVNTYACASKRPPCLEWCVRIHLTGTGCCDSYLNTDPVRCDVRTDNDRLVLTLNTFSPPTRFISCFNPGTKCAVPLSNTTHELFGRFLKASMASRARWSICVPPNLQLFNGHPTRSTQSVPQP
jgi:hypothetical protein